MNGSKLIRVSEKDLTPPNPLASLMSSSSGSDGQEKTEAEKKLNEKKDMTVYDYDMKLWFKKLQQQCIPLVIIPIVHIKFGAAIPLVMSVLIGIMNIFDDPLVRIYVRKQNPAQYATLHRPFPPIRYCLQLDC